MLYENENTNDGMLRVLKHIQSLQTIDDQETENDVFSTQPIFGDQLTVERGVSAILEVSNGFNSEQRFDGLHFEIADFHTSMKLLQVQYS